MAARSRLAALLAIALVAPCPARAQASVPGGTSAMPTAPEVTVSATRERRSVDETTASVSVIPAEEIESRFVRDLRGLVRNEPGVTVRRAPARFGAALGSTGRDRNASFNIRGLEGNRVLQQVDGIRVPAAFSFGASNFGRGDYTEVTSLRAVEIVRGPMSSLYGSDGIAGVVSFLTFDPADLLAGEDRHASAIASWASEDESTTLSLRGAARLGGDRAGTGLRAPEVMAIVTGRWSSELESFGDVSTANATRTAPNPQDNRSGTVLAKWVQPLSGEGRIRFTVERVRNELRADVLSARSAPPVPATGVLRLDAKDTIERDRASVDAVFEQLGWAVADRVQVAVYFQRSDTRQRSFEDRNTAVDRVRDNRYSERVVGVNSQFDLATRFAGFGQRIIYGIDYATAQIDNLRDGTVPPAGESFPTKAFPATGYDTLGAFIQSEIALAPRWFLTPALRYDRFSLDAGRDPLFVGAPVSISDSAMSPKLALRWRAGPAFTAYVNYAQGFRAPTPDQVNNGFTNLTSPFAAYRSIGNPGLSPERSETVELGMRGLHAGVRWSAAVYEGRYRDFIEQVTIGGAGTPANPLLFQFVNIGRVEIRGFEARASMRPAREWQLTAGLAWNEGKDVTRGRPLNSVQPARLLLGAEWTPTGQVRLGAFVNHARAKARADIDSSALGASETQFATPSSTVIDLVSSLRLNRHAEIGLGVFNVTDRKYWQWSDVQGVSSSSGLRNAFTQPGRNVALRMRATF